VERSTVVESFKVHTDNPEAIHPVEATLKNVKTGHEEVVRAKHLVGADGAASSIREQLGAPFDGLSTDIYWAIMDGVFKTDYPYHLAFR
jgi:phenol 2-monooxygenase